MNNSPIITCHSEPWQILIQKLKVAELENRTSLCSKLASTNYNWSLGKPKQMVCLHLDLSLHQ